jgi:UDP-glucuronate 4-epimerase
MVLVTGAAGFLGTRLMAAWRNEGLVPIGLRRTAKSKETKQDWIGDLAVRSDVARLARKTWPKTVVHLAARVDIKLAADPADPEGPPVPSMADPSAIYADNVVGTSNLIELCFQKGVSHLVFASSQSVYGLASVKRIVESTVPQPLEHYAASKVFGEMLCQMAARRGLRVTVLRIPGLFHPERRTGVVYKFCQQAITARHIRVEAQFPLPIDVLHVDDAVTGVIAACESKTKAGYHVYNLSTSEPCSLNRLADQISTLVPGCNVTHARVPQPLICLDASKARRDLRWRAMGPTARLKEMLQAIHER